MSAHSRLRIFSVLLTAGLLLCGTLGAIAQHQVEYAYDVAGNRLGRVAMTLRLNSQTPPSRARQLPADTIAPSVVPAGELSVRLWPNPTKGLVRL